MIRNPIYQALRTSGFLQRLEDEARCTDAHAKLYAAVRKERATLRSMWMRGAIDYNEYVELRGRVSRTLHARLLRDFFRRSEPRARQNLTRTISRVCPPGMSSYAFRMGHHLKSRRRDLA
jgi:hypothetical protein